VVLYRGNSSLCYKPYNDINTRGNYFIRNFPQIGRVFIGGLQTEN
jgi:hypothetical protein